MAILKFTKLPVAIYIVQAVISGIERNYAYVTRSGAEKRLIALKKWHTCKEAYIYTYWRES